MDTESDRPRPLPKEENLSQLLAEAERRKTMDLKQKAGKFNLIVGIPVALLAASAGIFLLTYDAGEPATVPAPAPVVETPELTNEQKDMAQFDLFRDEKDRVVKDPNAAPESGKIIDQEDIHFAMELLNFMQPPDKNKPARH